MGRKDYSFFINNYETDEQIKLNCLICACYVFDSQIVCANAVNDPLDLAIKFYEWIKNSPNSTFHKDKQQE